MQVYHREMSSVFQELFGSNRQNPPTEYKLLVRDEPEEEEDEEEEDDNEDTNEDEDEDDQDGYSE